MKYLITVFLLLVQLHAKEIYATFDVVAKQDASLAFITGGIVDTINADVGSYVKKGDLLAALQNDDIKASLQMAEISLKYAQRAYERQKKIKHLIDEAKFDQIAKAFESAKASYAYKKALYEKTFLKAPFDGVIYKRDLEIGDAVSGMMLKTVFKIQSQKERKLLVRFDQKYIKDVRIGDRFRYKIDGQNATYEATIAKIYPSSNIKNRKVTAEVYVTEITPGLFGDGFIITQGR